MARNGLVAFKVNERIYRDGIATDLRRQILARSGLVAFKVNERIYSYLALSRVGDIVVSGFWGGVHVQMSPPAPQVKKKKSRVGFSSSCPLPPHK